MKYFIPLLAFILMSCDEDKPSPRPAPTGSPIWEIGPITNSGKNYSINMPLHPTGHPDGWSFDFGPDSEPHYITFRHGPLTGKNIIRMSYRVEAADDVKIYGAGCSVDSASQITLYFQRAGDDWSTDGWRWWATPLSLPLAKAGEYSIEARLDGLWTSVNHFQSQSTPDAIPNYVRPDLFNDAKRNADRVGFTFANCVGYGHGARATGPVKFIVTNFEVSS
jgi:hypothetical protein